MIRVIGLSRIHITLFDLEGSLGRRDGGIGVALEHPRVTLRSGDCSSDGRVSYCIEEDYDEHVGLGHTTQFRMALAKLYMASIGRGECSTRDLALLASRGSTSGVGIYAFSVGGLVVDGGHSIKDKPEPLPSDFAKAPPPPLLFRYPFPWYVYVNVHRKGRRVFGREELEAFRRSASGWTKVSHIVLMSFLPSLVEGDIDGVLQAVGMLQGVGFKKVEVEMQTEEVKDLMSSLDAVGFPSGLSSFGPAVYTFTSTRRQAEELVSRFGGFFTRANNTGARVEVVGGTQEGPDTLGGQ